MNLLAKAHEDKIVLPDLFYDRINHYKKHLFKWNAVHNLTGAKNEKDLDRFIYDSLYPLSFLPPVRTALDIGTGAGFPGLILAMALPDTDFTLVEPLKKRAGFLQFIKADLGLNNVDVQNCRIEALTPFYVDLITSRAVTDTKLLLKLSRSFIKKGTLLLFYKGEKVFEEIDNSLDYRVIQTGQRYYLLIES
jgi:16S rRNA (guanine527-N7)-methyltransferase